MTVTAESFAAIPDHQLWEFIIERIFERTRDQNIDIDAVLQQLPPGWRMAWHLTGIESEVTNGGFCQFFYNSSGMYAPETLAALRAIGAVRRAEVLEEALVAFERNFGRPRDSRQRWDGDYEETPEMLALDEKYWNLTGGRYFDVPSRKWIERARPEDLEALLIRYLRAHVNDFIEAMPS